MTADNNATNGTGAAPGEAPRIDAETAKRQMAAAKQAAAAFGEIVAILMRSPADSKRSIGDLEWMVAPAIAFGQFMVAEAQSNTTGAVEPVGFVLWALVSPEIDQRLSDAAIQPNLAPREWRSGDIPWVIAGAGDAKIVKGLLHQLTKTVFKDREVKMRVQAADGKVTVGRLDIAEQAI